VGARRLSRWGAEAGPHLWGQSALGHFSARVGNNAKRRSEVRFRALECGEKAGTAPDPKEQANWHELERLWLELALRVVRCPR
jgi:hypothetical protein